MAEAYFSEGKQHNAAGDFWAAREYFVHAYVAAPSHALLLSVATPLLALTNTPTTVALPPLTFTPLLLLAPRRTCPLTRILARPHPYNPNWPQPQLLTPNQVANMHSSPLTRWPTCTPHP